MCIAFPTTLKGPSLKWFTSLPPYSVKYFNTLSTFFSTQFVGSVKQERDETLRAFIDRFSKVALKIKNFTQDLVLQYMAMALKPRPFVDNIYLRLPATMHELRLHVVDYIRMEEMRTLRTKFLTRLQPVEKKTKKAQARVDPKSRDPRTPRYSRYASLSAPHSRIMEEALHNDLIPPPQKSHNLPNSDMSKYCKYHHNNEYPTDECKALQDKI